MTLQGSPFVALFLPRLPAMLVWLAGLGYALATWRRHPRVSLLVSLAVALFLLEAVAGAWVTERLPFMVGGPAGRSGLLGLAQGVLGLVTAAGWGLLLWAAFGWRREARA